MAYTINLRTHTDNRGSLTVIEKEIPFEIKRVFYIYGADNSIRGGHRHKSTIQAAVCLNGSCKIKCLNAAEEIVLLLDSPDKCIILQPEDWHQMYDFTENAILLVLASEYYNPDDYIYERYL